MPTQSSTPHRTPANQPSPTVAASAVTLPIDARILVAEDDPISRTTLLRRLEKSGYQCIEADDGISAMEKMADDVFVALLDIHMPGTSGLQSLKFIREEFPDTQVIMVTSSDDVGDAVAAMKEGAVEYVTKPFKSDRLLALVDRCLATYHIAREHRGLSAVVGQSLPTTEFSFNATNSKRLKKQIARVAELDSTVLITGESGTGKTTIARMIHRQGVRSNGPFIAVNCASWKWLSKSKS